MRTAGLACCLLLAATIAHAGECGADAIGTSRTIVVDPAEHAHLGTMQYRETLPLRDKEIVITFDDGPLPPYTRQILDILDANCVKATYFLVGVMAKEFPALARAVHEAGHTVGTHSFKHPLRFGKLSPERMGEEIDDGITAVAAALGDPNEVAPFFRIPGLSRGEDADRVLAARGLMTWSADFPADDWKHISAKEIVRRAMSRLEAKGKGILLLHDIHAATVLALPELLRELQARGYRIVHVVPVGPDRPATETVAADWLLRPATGQPATTIADVKMTPHSPILRLPNTPIPAGIAPFGPTIPVALALPHHAAFEPIRRSEAASSAKRHVARRPAVQRAAEAGFPTVLGPYDLRGATN